MSAKFLRSLVDEVAGWDVLDRIRLIRLMRMVETRLAPLEQSNADVDAAVNALRQVAIDRINTVLTPAIQSVLDIQAKGFLLAESASPAALGVGDILTLAVEDAQQRALFTPSPFPALTRAGSADDYAVTRLVDWSSETGELILEVLAFWGDVGPHEDWIIVATAGVANAQREMLGDAAAARDRAKSWATAADGVEVDPGLFSARHHRNAAADSAAAALADKTAAAASALAATGSQTASAASAALASQLANAAEDVEIAPGLFSARHFAAKAATFDPDLYLERDEIEEALLAIGDFGTDLASTATLADAWLLLGLPANLLTAIAGKLDLAGGTVAGDLKTASGVKQAVTVLGNGSGARTLASATGCYFTATSTGVSTWTISGQPAAGEVRTIVLELTNGGAAAQTFTGVKWSGGLAPALTAAGLDRLIFTIDGAGNKIGALINKAAA